MICNNANNDIDWRILKDSPTIHKILCIQRYKDTPFLLVEGLYPIDYDKAMSVLVLITG